MSDLDIQQTSPEEETKPRKDAEEPRRVRRAFGTVLKAARAHSGMSQQTLADGACADRSYLSMLERGLQQPTLLMLFRIAKALSVRPEQLVADTVERLENGQPSA